jgi:hypothetical protein
MNLLRTLTLGALAAATLLSGADASAQAPTTYYGCVNNNTSALRITSATASCDKHEYRIQWNSVGPAGPPGPPGPAGGAGLQWRDGNGLAIGPYYPQVGQLANALWSSPLGAVGISFTDPNPLTGRFSSVAGTGNGFYYATSGLQRDAVCRTGCPSHWFAGGPASDESADRRDRIPLSAAYRSAVGFAILGEPVETCRAGVRLGAGDHSTCRDVRATLGYAVDSRPSRRVASSNPRKATGFIPPNS